MSAIERCRVTGSTDLQPFLDLGDTPLADALVDPDNRPENEAHFPLELCFCPESKLVQITHDVDPEVLFVDNYLYFSSFSDQVAQHTRAHAEQLVESRGLGPDSLVVELASNDGYLLRHFVELGIPVLGIDPAPGPAAAAREKGVPTLEEFFGVELAERLVAEGKQADVIIANNVMAHIPDPNDFVGGMKTLLADDGVITVENPYVKTLIDHCEFDTIYHEHYFYWSCQSVDVLTRRNSLVLNDVQHFPELHGGTLRWWIGHHEDRSDAVLSYLADEKAAGLDTFEYYADFGRRVDGVRAELKRLLSELRAEGARIVGYGAAAKGATLLNATGIGTDLVEYVVDRNPHKQGLLMSGTRQPIKDPSFLVEDRPDYVLLLAWNFEKEILDQQSDYREQGGRFIRPVPWPEVVT